MTTSVKPVLALLPGLSDLRLAGAHRRSRAVCDVFMNDVVNARSTISHNVASYGPQQPEAALRSPWPHSNVHQFCSVGTVFRCRGPALICAAPLAPG